MLDDSLAMAEIFSIGHSNHSLDRFIELLKLHSIAAVLDTRSYPVSRFAPHFNRPVLEKALPRHAIRYVFRGDELGGRPRGEEYYDEEGHVLYSRVAEARFFLDAIDRLDRGVRRKERRIALLCSEENPEHCHRRLLVGRVLEDRGVHMIHIRGDGQLEAEQPRNFGRTAGQPQQLGLFEQPEVSEWRSTRSVLQRGPRVNSSAH